MSRTFGLPDETFDELEHILSSLL